LEPARVEAEDAVWALALRRGKGARDGGDGDADLQRLWRRCCNRRTGASAPVAADVLAALARHGAPLLAEVMPAGDLPALGTALGALYRVRFLSRRLRGDMLGELRFGGEAAADGIDVGSLELDATDRAAMDVLRTGAGMDFLAENDRGWGLRKTARDAFAGSGGAIVLRAAALDDAALLDAGRGLMRLWLEATGLRLAIHPWGSPFLFQRLHEDPASLEPFERAALARAAEAFALDPAHPILLVLRVSHSGAPTARSLRRPLEEVLSFASSRPSARSITAAGAPLPAGGTRASRA
jgi:hypothetical protein